MYPKISIVTPSFNQGKFLAETIESVLDQDYPNLEYIIIDGGSTDNSVEIIEKHEKFITHWISEKDNGQSHAINKGLRKSTGDLVNWLNSDDLLEKESLHRIAEIYNDKKPLAIIGKTRKTGVGFLERVIPDTFSSVDEFEKTLVDVPFIQPSFFMSRKAIEGIGLLNETLHYCMDYEWYLRFLLNFGTDKIAYSNEVLAFARLHNDSKTVLNLEKFQNEKNAIWLNLCNELKAPHSLLGIIQKVGYEKKYFSNLKIEKDLEQDKLFSLINRKILLHYNDKSKVYRDACDYFAFFGNQKAVLNSSLKAISIAPHVLMNYKYFFRALQRQLGIG